MCARPDALSMQLLKGSGNTNTHTYTYTYTHVHARARARARAYTHQSNHPQKHLQGQWPAVLDRGFHKEAEFDAANARPQTAFTPQPLLDLWCSVEQIVARMRQKFAHSMGVCRDQTCASDHPQTDVSQSFISSASSPPLSSTSRSCWLDNNKAERKVPASAVYKIAPVAKNLPQRRHGHTGAVVHPACPVCHDARVVCSRSAFSDCCKFGSWHAKSKLGVSWRAFYLTVAPFSLSKGCEITARPLLLTSIMQGGDDGPNHHSMPTHHSLSSMPVRPPAGLQCVIVRIVQGCDKCA